MSAYFLKFSQLQKDFYNTLAIFLAVDLYLLQNIFFWKTFVFISHFGVIFHCIIEQKNWKNRKNRSRNIE